MAATGCGDNGHQGNYASGQDSVHSGATMPGVISFKRVSGRPS
jgi:hypothetical protein